MTHNTIHPPGLSGPGLNLTSKLEANA